MTRALPPTSDPTERAWSEGFTVPLGGPSATGIGGRGYTRVGVIIPALNEEQALPGVLADLPPVGGVWVVDNGSTDRTAEVALAGGATVLREPRKGYGLACQAGIRAALAAGVEVVVILDGDHADRPGDLPRLVDPILAGAADFVLSDRTRGAEAGALLPHQRAGNALAVRLIARATGHRYADMGPFRAIRADHLAAMQLRDPNHGWNVEMQMRAAQAGLRILEVPLPYRPRVGTSKVSGTVRGSVLAGARILRSVWRYRARG